MPDTEVTTNLAAARFKVIQNPIASPGCCGICGCVKCDDGFVTLDLDFEFYGTLIFCRNCALGIAAPVGGITPEKALSLELENARLAATVSSLQERLSIMQPIEDFINERINSSIVDVPIDATGDNVRSLPLPQEPDEQPEQAAEFTESTNLNVTELSSVERSDDSSDATSDLAELLGDLNV